MTHDWTPESSFLLEWCNWAFGELKSISRFSRCVISHWSNVHTCSFKANHFNIWILVQFGDLSSTGNSQRQSSLSMVFFFKINLLPFKALIQLSQQIWFYFNEIFSYFMVPLKFFLSQIEFEITRLNLAVVL